ncbi:hypothetical protein ACGIF2_07790 [Cellulomonas sp. P22]|uniref:hypothetical protein n=1 Tax=Cellulomonas sp. P22 TaxID=3373189 RepID=UPI0037AAE4A6
MRLIASQDPRWAPSVYLAAAVLFVLMTGYAVWELAQGGRGPGPWLAVFAWPVLAIGNVVSWRARLRRDAADASELSGQ